MVCGLIPAAYCMRKMCQANFSFYAVSVHPVVIAGSGGMKCQFVVTGSSCRKCAEFSREELKPLKNVFQLNTKVAMGNFTVQVHRLAARWQYTLPVQLSARLKSTLCRCVEFLS